MSQTHQARKDLRWTGRRDTFALGWQETVFEDVLYPGGILKVSVGLLERRDGVVGPQLCPKLGEDWRRGLVSRAYSGIRKMGYRQAMVVLILPTFVRRDIFANSVPKPWFSRALSRGPLEHLGE